MTQFDTNFPVDIYIARGEEQFGPYPLEQIRELLDQGALLPEDLAFHEGLDNWTPLAEVIAAQTAPKLPSPPLPAVLPPAQEESEAPETLPTGPSSGPQPASTTPTKSRSRFHYGSRSWYCLLSWEAWREVPSGTFSNQIQKRMMDLSWRIQ